MRTRASLVATSSLLLSGANASAAAPASSPGSSSRAMLAAAVSCAKHQALFLSGKIELGKTWGPVSTVALAKGVEIVREMVGILSPTNGLKMLVFDAVSYLCCTAIRQRHMTKWHS